MKSFIQESHVAACHFLKNLTKVYIVWVFSLWNSSI